MQCPVVHPDVHPEPGVLHAVAGVVLDAGHHVPLRAAGQRGTHGAEQDGFLAVGLLRPAPGRVPEQVDTDAAEEVSALGAHLRADGFAHPLLQSGVPGRPARHGHRKRRGPSDDRAARPVAEADAGYAQPGYGPRDDRVEVVADAHHVRHPRPERLVPVEEPQPLRIGALPEQRAGFLLR